MKALQGSLASIIGVTVLLFLLGIGVGSNQLLLGIAAIGIAVALTVLVGLGPEKMGIGLMIIGMLLAPLNTLRLIGNVTFSDIAFVLGFGLLIPRMLVKRPKLPPLYVIGVAILFTGGMISSLLAPLPVASLGGFLRLVAAAILLPFIMNLLQPSGRLVDTLAWAYVVGQIISTGYSVIRGGAGMAQGRAIGLSTHPNFYALAGQLAYALLIYLYYRVERQHRWVVVLAAAIIGFSVLNSGSRASLLCCIVVTIMWPIIERSAVAWYVIITGAIIAVIAAESVLRALGQETTLERLSGNTSAQYSDQAREQALESGFRQFWERPIQGNGWNDILEIHNAYLEVAVGGGVLCLLGFLLIVASLIRPLFRQGVPNRLAYAGLSYAIFALIGPTLYDRVLWTVLALILVTSAQGNGNGDVPDEAAHAPEDPPRARNARVSAPGRPRSR